MMRGDGADDFHSQPTTSSSCLGHKRAGGDSANSTDARFLASVDVNCSCCWDLFDENERLKRELEAMRQQLASTSEVSGSRDSANHNRRAGNTVFDRFRDFEAEARWHQQMSESPDESSMAQSSKRTHEDSLREQLEEMKRQLTEAKRFCPDFSRVDAFLSMNDRTSLEQRVDEMFDFLDDGDKNSYCYLFFDANVIDELKNESIDYKQAMLSVIYDGSGSTSTDKDRIEDHFKTLNSYMKGTKTDRFYKNPRLYMALAAVWQLGHSIAVVFFRGHITKNQSLAVESLVMEAINLVSLKMRNQTPGMSLRGTELRLTASPTFDWTLDPDKRVDVAHHLIAEFIQQMVDNTENCLRIVPPGEHYQADRELFSFEQYVCSECGKTLKSKNTLLNHIDYMHSVVTKYVSSMPFTCRICSKGIKYANNAPRHFKTQHPGLKPFLCELCSETFDSIGVYQSHVKTHSVN